MAELDELFNFADELNFADDIWDNFVVSEAQPFRWDDDPAAEFEPDDLDDPAYNDEAEYRRYAAMIRQLEEFELVYAGAESES